MYLRRLISVCISIFLLEPSLASSSELSLRHELNQINTNENKKSFQFGQSQIEPIQFHENSERKLSVWSSFLSKFKNYGLE